MNSKKSIIALLLVAIIGVVGLTIAYFTNTTTIENEFSTNPYGTTVTEEFVSPTNWLPGTQTDKTLIVTNSGSVDEAVRVSYTENWTSANSNTEGDLPLTQNGNRAALIHFTNTNDWTKVGDYYYYNYKLAPSESTSELLDYVTFNPAITNDADCETTANNGTTTITCNSSGDGYDGATYKLTFTIQTVQYDKYNEAWGLNNSVTIAAEKPEPPMLASQYLANNATNPANAEYNATTKGNMFTFSHTVNGNTVNETRYIGDAPKNYVKFNCDDDGTNCETWRILGVFSVEDGSGNVEQRMKLVRGNAFATDMYWNNGSSNNDWTDSNASLKNFLNGDYYNRTGDAATYGLKSSAQGMIDDAVFYLGGATYDSTTNYGSTEDVYAWERGTTTCGACNSDTTKLTWTGKVALMYPSDEYMVYGNGVDNNCYNDPAFCYSGATPVGSPTTGWVYNSNILEGESSVSNTWLLSPDSGDTSFAFFANSAGDLYSHGVHNRYSNGVRPVVYLKSSVKIAGGTGEVGSPYVLDLIQ